MQDTTRPKTKRADHIDRLWGLCQDVTFFATANGQTLALPNDNERCQGLVFPIHHPRFRQKLLLQYCKNYSGTFPSKAALNSVISLAHDRAVNSIDKHAAPGLRITAQPDSPEDGSPKPIAVHGNHFGEAWEISAEGVDISDEFLFFQGRGELPLSRPHPEPSPSALADFARLLRLASDSDWRRCLLWLLAAFRPHGPYPILILQGPPGCGKSHAARLLRSCIDPNRTPTLPLPSSAKKLRDLAYESWVLAFDHITRFPRRVGESLARLIENEIVYLPPKDDQTPLSLSPAPSSSPSPIPATSRRKSLPAPSSPGSFRSPRKIAKRNPSSSPPKRTFSPTS